MLQSFFSNSKPQTTGMCYGICGKPGPKNDLESTIRSAGLQDRKHRIFFNVLTAVGAIMTLTDFTLSNARRFYSSMGTPLGVKGLNKRALNDVKAS